MGEGLAGLTSRKSYKHLKYFTVLMASTILLTFACGHLCVRKLDPSSILNLVLTTTQGKYHRMKVSLHMLMDRT